MDSQAEFEIMGSSIIDGDFCVYLLFINYLNRRLNTQKLKYSKYLKTFIHNNIFSDILN